MKPFLAALDIAENSPYTRVSLDIGTEPAIKARTQILQLLPRLDVILPNETELMLLGRDALLMKALIFFLMKKVPMPLLPSVGQKDACWPRGISELNSLLSR
jgi:sugar/nucleoside kinase (ribokinase family)